MKVIKNKIMRLPHVIRRVDVFNNVATPHYFQICQHIKRFLNKIKLLQ